ncbi:MAG: lipoprotein, partial [Paludibacteraceae bacterium]|nr:lipoprotein [Paludibacteraceae bacterium]
MKYPIIFLGIAALLTACQPKHKQIMISDTTIQASIAAITTANPEVDVTLVTRGVEQV